MFHGFIQDCVSGAGLLMLLASSAMFVYASWRLVQASFDNHALESPNSRALARKQRQDFRGQDVHNPLLPGGVGSTPPNPYGADTPATTPEII
jgi:hypothetical protein